MKKTVYILRGLPGSGKSTLAKLIAGGLDTLYSEGGHPVVAVFSTDDFFVNKDGEYIYDRSRIAEAHNWNFKRFKEALGTYPYIIIDNTNTQKWEFEKYVEAAKKKDYFIQTITVGDPHEPPPADQNKHSCPAEAIQKMSNRFEQ